MKANEVPEKIYVSLFKGEYSVSRYPVYNVTEYIRKDAFIEKACDYLMEYEFNDSPTIADRRKRVDEFRKYMERE